MRHHVNYEPSRGRYESSAQSDSHSQPAAATLCAFHLLLPPPILVH